MSEQSSQKRIYLAGPDVFFRNPVELGWRKKTLCSRYGFDGVYPLDGDIDPDNLLSPYGKAEAIYIHLEKMMDGCDLIIANLTPFRSVSMDVGTAFEAGYMRAQGKPVLGYTNIVDDYDSRVRKYYSSVREFAIDADHQDTEVEAFGLSENLMIEIAIGQSGAEVVRYPAASGEEQTELGGFEECLKQAVKIFENE